MNDRAQTAGVSRRAFLARAASAGVGAAALGGLLPRVAAGQPARKVSLTLAWLAQGNTAYSLVAKEKGFWSKRGLDVDISRGFGSTATVQAMGAGKFNFGLAAAPSIMLGAAKGLPLLGLGPTSYSTTMGIVVLADSPIARPRDLEGKTLGVVPASVEAPFLPAYGKVAGFDFGKVQTVHVDNKVLEQVLIQKSVDAISATATSSLPKFVSRGVPIRFLLFQEHGLDLYGITVVTQKALVAREPELCQQFVDGLFEGIAFTLLNPAESLEIFFRVVPEEGLTPSSREFTKLGLGLYHYTVLSDEARKGGLGWADPKRLAENADLIMRYVAEAGTPRPEPDSVFTSRFAGRIKLTPEQWTQAERNVAPFAKYLRPS